MKLQRRQGFQFPLSCPSQPLQLIQKGKEQNRSFQQRAITFKIPWSRNGEGESIRERLSQSFKGHPGCDVDVDVLETKVESEAGAGARQAEDDGAARCPADRRHRGLLRVALAGTADLQLPAFYLGASFLNGAEMLSCGNTIGNCCFVWLYSLPGSVVAAARFCLSVYSNHNILLLYTQEDCLFQSPFI